MDDEVEYTIDEVAAKLKKSRRWLERQIAEDLRKMPADRKLQHHYRIGASKRWDEERYRALKAGIIEQCGDARKRNPRVIHTYQGSLSLALGQSSSEQTLAALERIIDKGRSPKRSASGRKARRKTK